MLVQLLHALLELNRLALCCSPPPTLTLAMLTQRNFTSTVSQMRHSRQQPSSRLATLPPLHMLRFHNQRSCVQVRFSSRICRG
jgi:hypothetical protein